MTLPADVWMKIGQNLPNADLAKAALVCKEAYRGAAAVARDRNRTLDAVKPLQRQSEELKTCISIADKRAMVLDGAVKELRKHRKDPAWKYSNRKEIDNLAKLMRDVAASAKPLHDVLLSSLDQLDAYIEYAKKEIARLKSGKRLPDETDEDFKAKKANIPAIAQTADKIAKVLGRCLTVLRSIVATLNELFLEFYGYCSVRVAPIKL